MGISYSFSGIVVKHGTSPCYSHIDRHLFLWNIFFLLKLLHYIGFIIAFIVITEHGRFTVFIAPPMRYKKFDQEPQQYFNEISFMKISEFFN